MNPAKCCRSASVVSVQRLAAAQGSFSRSRPPTTPRRLVQNTSAANPLGKPLVVLVERLTWPFAPPRQGSEAPPGRQDRDDQKGEDVERLAVRPRCRSGPPPH